MLPWRFQEYSQALGGNALLRLLALVPVAFVASGPPSTAASRSKARRIP